MVARGNPSSTRIGAGLQWLRRLGMSPREEGETPLVARTLPDRSGTRAPLRILVFADAVGATLQINLLRPLRGAVDAGACSLYLVSEAEETAWRRAGGRAAEAALGALWQAADPTVVFVSRYGGSLAAEIVAMASGRRTPLVYHLDDNLFEVPPEAGTAKAAKYGAPDRQAAMRLLVSRADLVYLSTTRLQDQLHAIGVLPARPDATWVGAIASASDPLEPLTAAATSDGLSPVFGYMASSSHRPDLALALPGIEAVLRNDPTARFEIYGSLAMPAPLCERFGPRVRHHAAVADYDAFLGGLRDLGWSWGIAPLRPGRFHEAKTDTKWVEYAAARIPCLASQHAVYADCLSDGAAVGVSDAEWEAALPRALADTRLRTETLERSRRRLSARHNLARMTSQLQDVFRRVGVAPDLLSLPTLTSG